MPFVSILLRGQVGLRYIYIILLLVVVAGTTFGPIQVDSGIGQGWFLSFPFSFVGQR